MICMSVHVSEPDNSYTVPPTKFAFEEYTINSRKTCIDFCKKTPALRYLIHFATLLSFFDNFSIRNITNTVNTFQYIHEWFYVRFLSFYWFLFFIFFILFCLAEIASFPAIKGKFLLYTYSLNLKSGKVPSRIDKRICL